MQRADLAGFVLALDDEGVAIQVGLNGGGQGPGKLALGAFDAHGAFAADV